MKTSTSIVIVGAGMAAYAVAREFRKLDKTAALTLVTADAGASYAKPMLSNAIALGKGPSQLTSASAEQMAAALDVQVLTNTSVTGIDRARRRIVTARGELAFHRLVLALGAEPVRLALQGDGAEHVLSVNHLDDYLALRARLDKLDAPAHIAILGAGLVGCEFAEDLAAGNHSVTLVDSNSRPLAALAAPKLSSALVAAWSSKSISLRLETTATAVERYGERLRVLLTDGGTLLADIVLSAVGLRPRTALAQHAGLAIAQGILVDEYGCTTDPDIYALGDCAEYQVDSTSAVLPYVAPLLTAARAIGATLAGNRTPIAVRDGAVAVKTPSCRLALFPPARGMRGEWQYETYQSGGQNTHVARFVDEAGVLRGFGLAPDLQGLRRELLMQLGKTSITVR